MKVMRAEFHRFRELRHESGSIASSMSLQAFVTIAVLAASMDMPAGWQRRHARKPAAWASPMLSCSLTFLGLARRDGHDGRQ